jgi:hypothetical protein
MSRIRQTMQHNIAFMRFDNLRVHIWPGALLNRVEPSDVTSL